MEQNSIWRMIIVKLLSFIREATLNFNMSVCPSASPSCWGRNWFSQLFFNIDSWICFLLKFPITLSIQCVIYLVRQSASITTKYENNKKEMDLLTSHGSFFQTLCRASDFFFRDGKICKIELFMSSKRMFRIYLMYCTNVHFNYFSLKLSNVQNWPPTFLLLFLKKIYISLNP